MSDAGSRMILSSHEILRFSVEQAGMHFRHLGLYRDRVYISLRDHSPARNLWELVHIGDAENSEIYALRAMLIEIVGER